MKRLGPKPDQVKRFDLAELGISLKCSDECLRKLDVSRRLPAVRSRNIIFD